MYLNERFRPLVVGRGGFEFYTQVLGGGDWYILVLLLINNRNGTLFIKVVRWGKDTRIYIYVLVSHAGEDSVLHGGS